jgi:PAS domain S-box-containing protein
VARPLAILTTSALHRRLLGTAVLIAALASPGAAQSGARNVLLLNSFQRGMLPHTEFAEKFRAELSRESPEPVNFLEMSLQPGPLGPMPDELPFVDYLRSTLAGRRLDLVVAVGASAATFAGKYREQLFPGTPLLQSGVDASRVPVQTLTPQDTVVAVTEEAPRIVGDMLALRSDIRHVLVVIGASDFEAYWRREIGRDLERFADPVTFEWTEAMPFTDVLKRASTLPPHSAIVFLTMSVDAAGVQMEGEALAQLHAVANAPIFGVYESQVGGGAVGGALVSIGELARSAAGVATRLLHGEPAEQVTIPPTGHGPPTFDWRELQRWGIREAALPAGSVVLFRQPGIWERYKGYIVSAAALLLLQTGLIAALLVQRSHRTRAERALRESEARFRLMANGAPLMVWTATPDMATDFFNATVLEFTGLRMDQLVGDGWFHRIHPDDLDRCLSTYQPAFEARQPFQLEYRFRRADDTYRWVFDTGVPRYGPDGVFAGYIGSALDITERKEMEHSLVQSQAELRRSYEENRDLAGRLIHAQEAERARIASDLHDDVSQQVAGVGIMLSGLKRNLGQAEALREADETIEALQKRTASLAHSIRHLSHNLHPGMLKHAGLAAALTQHCAEVQRQHGTAVTLAAQDDLDTLEFDVALCLYRVTQEALTNIVRHARAGTARVELTRTEQGVELRVTDDGIGFLVSEHARRGLGLRSIDERVRLTGGEVRVNSEPGQGTHVVVRIPLALPEMAGARKS